MTRTVTGVWRRGRQAVRILREEGGQALLRRGAHRISRRLGGGIPELALMAVDVADSSTLVLPPAPAPVQPDSRLVIGWICAPPSAGSGGHTTMFRFVEALERAGHTCVLYVYDRFGGDIATHEEVVRSWWPQIQAEVREVSDEVGPADAFVATSWTTAHVLASRVLQPGWRFYLVQDFEPFFFARGSEYALAEDTYRFGFQHITVGHMVANVLSEYVGVESLIAEFGCDRSTYRLLNAKRRQDVVFYTKPDTPRRGYSLGVLALERFHNRHPECTIHTFGMAAGELPFPANSQLHLAPAELNELYNRCAVGLALSFTNISLIAQELLASGTVPVVNDSSYTRADLTNPHVGWSAATPDAIADALSAAIEGASATPTEIAESVSGSSWDEAQRLFLEAIEDKCYAQPRTT